METTITVKVEIKEGEKLNSAQLNWLKYNLTKEFVQILNDTVPGQILCPVTTRYNGKSGDREESSDRLFEYKISPLLKNRSIVDFLR